MYEHLPETEKAYWAGILDGEGHLKLQTNNKGVTMPLLNLKMTCERTVRKFSETFDLAFVQKNKDIPSFKPHWKTQYLSSSEGHKVAFICEALLPYFITKQDIAKKISEFYYKDCLVCGTEFRGFNGQKYCNRKCERIAFNKTRREKRKGNSFKAP